MKKPAKEPQEECKHLWDCKEYNPKCHICGKLMRDDSFYDEDDHCNHAWEEGNLYCMYCGKSRETFTPMTPQEETYQTLENKALEEFDDKFQGWKNTKLDFITGEVEWTKAREINYIVCSKKEAKDFLKSHLKEAYEAGQEEERDKWINTVQYEMKIKQKTLKQIEEWCAKKQMVKVIKGNEQIGEVIMNSYNNCLEDLKKFINTL